MAVKELLAARRWLKKMNKLSMEQYSLKQEHFIQLLQKHLSFRFVKTICICLGSLMLPTRYYLDTPPPLETVVIQEMF